MLFNKCKTTKDQGNIGLAEAISYFTRNCYTVSIPINDSQDYDLVVDIDACLHRVQVKTTRQLTPSGNYAVEMRNKGGTTGTTYNTVSNGSSTLLFILCENGVKYLLPKEVYVTIKSQLTLGDKYADYILL